MEILAMISLMLNWLFNVESKKSYIHIDGVKKPKREEKDE